MPVLPVRSISGTDWFVSLNSLKNAISFAYFSRFSEIFSSLMDLPLFLLKRFSSVASFAWAFFFLAVFETLYLLWYRRNQF